MKKIIFIFLAIILLLLFLPYTYPQKNNPADEILCSPLEIFILNVSQADSIIIISNEKTILIDSGSKIRKNSSEKTIYFLKSKNITKIDYVIATHNHEDHIGGMADVFLEFGIGKIMDNGNCANYSTKTIQNYNSFKKALNYAKIVKNTQIKIDECTTAYFFAPYSNHCFSDENQNSIVIKIVHGANSFLFTGDCSFECENELINSNINLSSDFLKIGHHGSEDSSSMEFLRKVNAKIYAISVDFSKSADLGYFLPRKNPLERIYLFNGSFYRTDLNGDIYLFSDGKNISVYSEKYSSQCDLFSGYASSEKESYGQINEQANCT